MLSNNGLCLRAAVQYMLLFLARFNNSDWSQIYRLIHSYSSRSFLCALARYIVVTSRFLCALARYIVVTSRLSYIPNTSLVPAQHIRMTFNTQTWLLGICNLHTENDHNANNAFVYCVIASSLEHFYVDIHGVRVWHSTFAPI